MRSIGAGLPRRAHGLNIARHRKPRPVARRNPPSDNSGPSSAVLAARLWRDYLGRYRGRLLLALFSMAVYAASAAAIPAGVEWINARLSGETPTFAGLPERVGLWGPLVIVALGLLNAGAQYVQARLSASAALLALRDLQSDMTAKLVAIDDAQLRALGQGQSIGRLTNGVAVLRETLTRALTAIRDLLTLIALCAVMIYYDWALFIVVVLIYALLGWPVARIGARLRKSARAAQSQLGEIAAATGEIVAGGRMIRAYGLEEEIAAQSRKGFNRRLETLQAMARLRALNEPFVFFVGSLALALVIAVVAMAYLFGWLAGAGLPPTATYIIGAIVIVQPLRDLGINPWVAHFFVFLLSVWGELSPPTSLTAAVSARIAEASFIRTMWEALKICIPITLMTFAIFVRNEMVISPGWMQVFATLLVTVSTCGITFAMFGRFTRNPGANIMLRSLLALFAPDAVWRVPKGAIEPYGGVLLHTWLDRDLSLAGRIVLRDGATLRTELVDLERPVLRVPSLAIHLNRELASEGLKLNAQQHLAPVVGLSEKASLEFLLRGLRVAGHARGRRARPLQRQCDGPGRRGRRRATRARGQLAEL